MAQQLSGEQPLGGGCTCGCAVLAGHGSRQQRALTAGREHPELLWSPVPLGSGAAAEVQKRLTLWEERRFEELLRRAEEHPLFSRRPGREVPTTPRRRLPPWLVSSTLSFDESQDSSRPRNSSSGAQAYCGPQLDPPPAPPDEDWDRPLPLLASLAHVWSTSLTY